MMKNVFYFALKVVFLLKVFVFVTFWSRLDKKDKVNFKVYDVKTWFTNNCNPYVAQYLTKGNQTMEFGQLIEHNKRNNFFSKIIPKYFLKT